MLMMMTFVTGSIVSAADSGDKPEPHLFYIVDSVAKPNSKNI